MASLRGPASYTSSPGTEGAELAQELAALCVVITEALQEKTYTA